MAKNDFKAFATSDDANVISQDDYDALAARSSGFQSGVAKSAQLNKVWRQSSIMAAVLAQFITDRAGQDAIDDGSTDTLSANLKTAIFNDAELTGTPIAPTPDDNDNSTRVATTAFVQSSSINYATQDWVRSYAVNGRSGASYALSTDNEKKSAWLTIDEKNVGRLWTEANLDPGKFQPKGRLIAVRAFYVGTWQYFPSPGTAAVKIRVWGAGGSGSGCPATGANQVAVGSGGGSGAYGEGYYSSNFAGIWLVVGAGGARATGYLSHAGGTSSAGSLISAPGGNGGSCGGPTTAPWVTGHWGSGPATGNAYLLTRGAPGNLSMALTPNMAFGGPGASSQFGGGGGAAMASHDAADGGSFAAGGGGTANTENHGAITGGAGADGIILIEEYGVI